MSKMRIVTLLSLIVIALGAMMPRPAGAEQAYECLVGGPNSGATGCEIGWGVPGSGGECSVTCMEGYYACCNPSMCRCKPL
jgi:hypothetical protein